MAFSTTVRNTLLDLSWFSHQNSSITCSRTNAADSSFGRNENPGKGRLSLKWDYLDSLWEIITVEFCTIFSPLIPNSSPILIFPVTKSNLLNITRWEYFLQLTSLLLLCFSIYKICCFYVGDSLTLVNL